MKTNITAEGQAEITAAWQKRSEDNAIGVFRAVGDEIGRQAIRQGGTGNRFAQTVQGEVDELLVIALADGAELQTFLWAMGSVISRHAQPCYPKQELPIPALA